jgi:hypothetical protein
MPMDEYEALSFDAVASCFMWHDDVDGPRDRFR